MALLSSCAPPNRPLHAQTVKEDGFRSSRHRVAGSSSRWGNALGSNPEGATPPDGTNYSGIKYVPQKPGSEPTLADAEIDDAEGQPDQPGDLDASKDAQEVTE